MAKKTVTLKDYPLYYMWHIAVTSERKVRDAIKYFDISIPDWRVIFTLHENDNDNGLSISDISKESLIDPSVLSRTIKSLEERDIVMRKKREGDQRYTLIHLLPKGEELYEKVVPIVFRQQEENLHGLSSEERKKILKILKHMKSNAYRSPYLIP